MKQPSLEDLQNASLLLDQNHGMLFDKAGTSHPFGAGRSANGIVSNQAESAGKVEPSHN